MWHLRINHMKALARCTVAHELLLRWTNSKNGNGQQTIFLWWEIMPNAKAKRSVTRARPTEMPPPTPFVVASVAPVSVTIRSLRTMRALAQTQIDFNSNLGHRHGLKLYVYTYDIKHWVQQQDLSRCGTGICLQICHRQRAMGPIRRTFWMTWNESLATGFWLIDHENEIARDSSEETKKYISNR